jgi:hypothetical protein
MCRVCARVCVVCVCAEVFHLGHEGDPFTAGGEALRLDEGRDLNTVGGGRGGVSVSRRGGVRSRRGASVDRGQGVRTGGGWCAGVASSLGGVKVA